ncbi:MAG: hypothetical protein WD512_17195 [Candidatus Paceibacterota bacterium]
MDKALEILRDIHVSSELLKEQQTILKNMLKTGKVDSAFYQQQLTKLKQANQLWLDLIKRYYEKFLVDNLTLEVSITQQEEVLKFLGARYL